MTLLVRDRAAVGVGIQKSQTMSAPYWAEERAAERATSINEELSEFDKDMDEILTKADQTSIDPETRAATKRREDAIIQDGRQIRENAMLGMSEGDSSSQDKSRKKRKRTEQNLAELREQRERLDERQQPRCRREKKKPMC